MAESIVETVENLMLQGSMIVIRPEDCQGVSTKKALVHLLCCLFRIKSPYDLIDKEEKMPIDPTITP